MKFTEPLPMRLRDGHNQYAGHLWQQDMQIIALLTYHLDRLLSLNYDLYPTTY